MASMDNVGRDCRGNLFGIIGEGRLVRRNVRREFGFEPRVCDLHKTLDYSPWISLCSCMKSGIQWSDYEVRPNAFSVSRP
jgi:hypothetical protein